MITGGTGSVGSNFADFLSEQRFEVSILSRSIKTIPNTRPMYGIIRNFLIDKEAFDNCDYIIHLAGAGIADKRWTKTEKKKFLTAGS